MSVREATSRDMIQPGLLFLFIITKLLLLLQYFWTVLVTEALLYQLILASYSLLV